MVFFAWLELCSFSSQPNKSGSVLNFSPVEEYCILTSSGVPPDFGVSIVDITFSYIVSSSGLRPLSSRLRTSDLPHFYPWRKLTTARTQKALLQEAILMQFLVAVRLNYGIKGITNESYILPSNRTG